MVVRVKRLAVLADDQPLRAGAVFARGGDDIFAVMARRFLREPTLAVLKDAAVVREAEFFSSGNAVERWGEVDLTFVDHATGLIFERDGLDQQFVVALGRTEGAGLLGCRGARGDGGCGLPDDFDGDGLGRRLCNVFRLRRGPVRRPLRSPHEAHERNDDDQPQPDWQREARRVAHAASIPIGSGDAHGTSYVRCHLMGGWDARTASFVVNARGPSLSVNDWGYGRRFQ